MLRLRVRLKTLMIIVAFVALILTVIIQGVLLRRATIMADVSRAETQRARDQALLREAQAHAALEQANQLLRESKPQP